ncbi:MAG: hypothetical protein ACHQKZ_10430, partial [Solirubrobacterales bacterium]
MPSRVDLTNISAASTRTRVVRDPLDRVRQLLELPQVVVSPETGLEYRVERLVGAGGYGQAYLARR